MDPFVEALGRYGDLICQSCPTALNYDNVSPIQETAEEAKRQKWLAEHCPKGLRILCPTCANLFKDVQASQEDIKNGRLHNHEDIEAQHG